MGIRSRAGTASQEIRIFLPGTTADGQFSFEDVRSGTHKREVTAPGFVRTVVEDVFFNPNNTDQITVALDAGSAGAAS